MVTVVRFTDRDHNLRVGEVVAKGGDGVVVKDPDGYSYRILHGGYEEVDPEPDVLAKAWDPHPRPWQGRLEEDWVASGEQRLLAAYRSLTAVLHLRRWARFAKSEEILDDLLLKAESKEDFLARVTRSRPEELSLDDYLRIVDYVVDKYLTGSPDSERHAVASFLTARVRTAFEAFGKTAGALYLPSSLSEAIRSFRLGARDAEAVTYSKMSSDVAWTRMTENLRGAAKQVVIHHLRGTTTRQELAQRLFERFSEQNRDWRRFAMTETASAAAAGTLTSLKPGTHVQIREMPDACDYCRAQDGEVLTYVDPHRGLDWHTEVWVGKSNVGRTEAVKSRDGHVYLDEERAKPCVPRHPHCRGWYEPVDGEESVDLSLLPPELAAQIRGV